jgi:hypothetical protein
MFFKFSVEALAADAALSGPLRQAALRAVVPKTLATPSH